jgi:DNA-binding transcriptional regulator YiaG
METTADVIKHVRKKMGLTQAKFSALIGVSRASVAKYETSKAIPPGDVILKVLKLHGPNSLT